MTLGRAISPMAALAVVAAPNASLPTAAHKRRETTIDIQTRDIA